MISRRFFLHGLIAAPAVVAVESLMPLRGLVMPQRVLIRTQLPPASWRLLYQGVPIRVVDNPELFRQIIKAHIANSNGIS